MKTYNSSLLNDFPLVVLRFDHNATVQPHDHHFHELVLVVSGEGKHIAATGAHTIGSGDIFLLKPGVSHGYEARLGFSIFNVLYQPEKLCLPLFDLAREPGYRAFFELEPAMRRQFGFRKHFRLGKSRLDEMVLLVEQMERELDSAEPGHRFRAVTLFMRLLERVSSCVGNSTHLKENRELFRLGDLVDFMERHRYEPLSVPVLAARASMSPSTLNRSFRKAVGKSPMNFLNDLRITDAEQLLTTHPDLSVSEVAGRCGFPDSNYFTRLFRNRVGVTPREFRRNLES